ncbi:MAG: hypothetical protein QOH81_1965 [Sphingomonadales bacterium]|jgi:hypothetical protein|nr:hypothetical protein [Sphingomonadales bacterium]
MVEHDLARTLIIDLVVMTGKEDSYESKVHVLGEEVMHHIDEEDRGLLAHARTAWEEGRIDLVPFGERMRERRQDWYDRVAATVVTPRISSSSRPATRSRKFPPSSRRGDAMTASSLTLVNSPAPPGA